MKYPVNRLVIVCGCLAWVLAATGAKLPTGTGDKPPALEARGLALGGQTAMVCVARDKAAWDAVKQAAGRQSGDRCGLSGHALGRSN